MESAKTFERKGTRRLRRGRYSATRHIYHINTATHQRFPIFQSLKNGRILTRAIMRAQNDGHVETLAFVIMPDHLHWLMQLTGNHTLADCVNAVKSESARRISKHGKYTRQIWQRGFYDRALRKEDDVVDVARYIIANPVRAGIVHSVGEYPLWDAVWV